LIVCLFSLASGKRSITTEKGKFGAAPHPEDFRVIFAGIRAKENYGGGVFGLLRGHEFTSTDYADFTDSKTVRHERHYGVSVVGELGLAFFFLGVICVICG
jgi:hypothetical protein